MLLAVGRAGRRQAWLVPRRVARARPRRKPITQGRPRAINRAGQGAGVVRGFGPARAPRVTRARAASVISGWARDGRLMRRRAVRLSLPAVSGPEGGFAGCGPAS